jgi:hypothetical protein
MTGIDTIVIKVVMMQPQMSSFMTMIDVASMTLQL